MALTKITSTLITDDAVTTAKINADAVDETKIADNAVNSEHLVDGGVDDAHLATGIDATKLTGSIANARIPAGAVTQHVTVPKLDSPVITGTLSVLDEGTVTHTIANWSDDLSYTITPTNCTAGAVNGSGEFVITHTSGTPSYTIKAITASLGLDDSDLVTKNITMTLTAPTLSSPADVGTAEDVVYTITSTDSNDDKLILDPGTANFTYQSVSVGSASKVGNTVECTGFTTNNPAVTIQFTAEATYSVTAKAVKIDGTFGTSANSSADSITIVNYIAPTATGGTITTPTIGGQDYKVHTFTSSGTFQITANPGDIDVLVVAGGGGGASQHSAGGGGGGVCYNSASSSSSGNASVAAAVASYTVIVGNGGAGGCHSGGDGTKGQNSSFIGTGISFTAEGGGGGGSYNSHNGGSGGNGGGGGSNAGSGGSGSAWGFDGGNGGSHCGNTTTGGSGGGGGGGAGEAGDNASTAGASVRGGGSGGNGVQNNIDGNNYYWAGGGGGGNHCSATTGDRRNGGLGGGGGGGWAHSGGNAGGTGGGSALNAGSNGGSHAAESTADAGGSGGANTGGGGGGSGSNDSCTGGGGSGIVIVRYLR